jgi:hypothetical protein
MPVHNSMTPPATTLEHMPSLSDSTDDITFTSAPVSVPDLPVAFSIPRASSPPGSVLVRQGSPGSPRRQHFQPPQIFKHTAEQILFTQVVFKLIHSAPLTEPLTFCVMGSAPILGK